MEKSAAPFCTLPIPELQVAFCFSASFTTRIAVQINTSFELATKERMDRKRKIKNAWSTRLKMKSISFTKNAASELLLYNIRVNAILPVAKARMTDALAEFRGDERERLIHLADPTVLVPSFVFLPRKSRIM